MSTEIRRYTDLEKLNLGIIPLTGEACHLGYRILFDLTAIGKKIFIETYGLHTETKFNDSWNSGTASNPHVASVMIPYDAWHPLAIFGLLHYGCHTVLYYDGQQPAGCPQGSFKFIGISDADCLEQDENDVYIGMQKLLEIYKRVYGEWKRTFHVDNNLPGSGTRCQHQMSGRID